MKQGKSRTLQPVALPKALLPDPDSLLQHIDRAVMSTEYARASQDLTNIPPGPSVFNSHSKITQTASKDVEDCSRTTKGFLQGSLVEDFLEKVTAGNLERRSNRGRRNSKHAVVFNPEPSLSSSQPRSSGSKIDSSSGKVNKSKNESSSDTGRILDTEFGNFSVNSLNDQPAIPPTSLTVTVSRFNPSAHDMFPRSVAPKFSFFQPAKASLKTKVFTNDSGSEYDYLDGERTSSASSTATGSPSEKMMRHGSPLVFSSAVDFSTLLPSSLDLVDKLDSPNETPVKYDAVAADQAYRAGSAAMEEGDMVQAIALLRLASIKCPRNKPSALVKIEKLITAAAQQLEMQEASRNIDEGSDFVEQEKEVTEEVERHLPMKVLAVGDMLKADEAYRAGVAALEAGEPEKALGHLQKAIVACPEDRRNATTKINTLIDQANFELRMRQTKFDAEDEAFGPSKKK